MKHSLLITMQILSLMVLSSSLTEQLIEISDENYDSLTLQNENLLIFFYQEPCTLCKQILPELIKADEHFVGLEANVRVGTVNCSNNTQLKRRFNLESDKNILTVKYISKGIPMNYTGGRTSDDIISWVKMMLGPSIGEVKAVKEIEELKAVVKNMLVFFGNENSNNYNTFYKVAKTNQKLIFITCKSLECFDYFNVDEGNVIFFKKPEKNEENLQSEKYKPEFKLSSYTEEELKEFLLESSKPSVMTFDLTTATLIFEQKHIPGLFIYRSKSASGDPYYNLLSQIANKVKGKLQPVITDIVDIAETKLAEMIGIKVLDLPVVMIHDTREHLKSYKMTEDVTEENILNFVENWENNLLTRHIKSKEEPSIKEEGVKTLVGSTMELYVKDKAKDVVVIFYAPWCKHSKEFLPIYEAVSKKIESATGDNLLMAKFDAHHNEASMINLKYYPTVALWKADDKNEFIEFKEERTEDNLIKFLHTHSSFGFDIEKEKEF